ncbi:unnamed protein product [Prunus armeniaca]
MYMKIFKGNWERGNWPTTCAVKLGKWLGKSWSGNYVLSTGTLNNLKATGKWEGGQPPVHSNQAGLGNGETGQPSVQSNWAGGFGNHCQTANCVLSTSRRKYLKATVIRKNGQPLVQSNRVGGLGNHCRTLNCVLSATGNGETGQLHVQPNRVGGWGNHGWTTNCVLSTGTCKYLETTGNWERVIWPTTYVANWAGGFGNHCRKTNCVLGIGTSKYEKATRNEETGQPPMQSNRAGGWGNHGRTTNCSLSTVKSSRWLMKSLPDN